MTTTIAHNHAGGRQDCARTCPAYDGRRRRRAEAARRDLRGVGPLARAVNLVVMILLRRYAADVLAEARAALDAQHGQYVRLHRTALRDGQQQMVLYAEAVTEGLDSVRSYVSTVEDGLRGPKR